MYFLFKFFPLSCMVHYHYKHTWRRSYRLYLNRHFIALGKFWDLQCYEILRFKKMGPDSNNTWASRPSIPAGHLCPPRSSLFPTKTDMKSRVWMQQGIWQYWLVHWLQEVGHFSCFTFENEEKLHSEVKFPYLAHWLSIFKSINLF